MKSIAGFTGKPNTLHLTEVTKPTLDQIPNGRGVLMKVLRVGVDGADKEINAAEYEQLLLDTTTDHRTRRFWPG
jgi:glucose 1-dehydrogenase